MKCNDIESMVNEFQKSNDPELRYASFDYCYNYFYSSNKALLLNDKEKACAFLGFYLASWGMLRSSRFLIEKSYKYYIPVIEYIAKIDKSVWEINPGQYLDSTIQNKIISIYNDIKTLIIKNNNQDKIVVTKIMLGVFGIVPAYDNNFCKAFKTIMPEISKFSVFNNKSLIVIGHFYKDNKEIIDKLSSKIETNDFSTGEKMYNYPLAKIIDMYGFIKGQKI